MISKKSLKALPLFFLACFAALSFGGLFIPGEWYQNLNRAPWNPPNVVFPVVWTILYILIAIAGWLIFAEKDSTLKKLWVIQLVVNAAWSWIFFGQHWVIIGLIDIIILDLLVIAIVYRGFKQNQKIAAILMTPYLAWLLLATSLNAYIAVMN